MKKSGLEKAIGNCNPGALASFLRSLLLKHVEENSTDESPFIATDIFKGASRISSLLEGLEKQSGKQSQTAARKNNPGYHRSGDPCSAPVALLEILIL